MIQLLQKQELFAGFNQFTYVSDLKTYKRHLCFLLWDEPLAEIHFKN